MTLDKPEAAEALAAVTQSQSRSRSLYGYSNFSPYLFLTGAMWLAADVTFQFAPAARNWVWAVASLIAVPLFIGLAARQSVRRPRTKGQPVLDRYFWRGMGIWGLAIALMSGVIVIFGPIDGFEVHSFIGLVSGIAYAAAGLWMGWRILAAGLVIAALSLIGHIYVDDYYSLYMGVVGGGGMMLGAWWLRRV